MAIGNWDNTGCHLLFAPITYKNVGGSNPAAFNSGKASFLYRGASAGGTEYGTLTNMGSGFGYTTDGVCLHDDANDEVTLSNTTVTLSASSSVSLFTHAKIASIADGVYAALMSGYTDASNLYYLAVYRVGSNYYVSFWWNKAGAWGGQKSNIISNPVGAYHTFGAVIGTSGSTKLYLDSNDITDGTCTYSSADLVVTANKIGYQTYGPFALNGEFKWAALFNNARSTANITADHANADDFYGLIGVNDAPGTDQAFDSLVAPTTSLIYNPSCP